MPAPAPACQAPPPTRGPVLPTWRLSQTEGSVQKVQGRVDAGLSQALYGNLVAGTQQVLARVLGLCARSKGRAGGRMSLGIPRANATFHPDPDLPARVPLPRGRPALTVLAPRASAVQAQPGFCAPSSHAHPRPSGLYFRPVNSVTTYPHLHTPPWAKPPSARAWALSVASPRPRPQTYCPVHAHRGQAFRDSGQTMSFRGSRTFRQLPNGRKSCARSSSPSCFLTPFLTVWPVSQARGALRTSRHTHKPLAWRCPPPGRPPACFPLRLSLGSAGIFSGGLPPHPSPPCAFLCFISLHGSCR